MNPIILKKQSYEAVLSAENGALLSFKSCGKEMLMPNTCCAVLEVRLLTVERTFRFFTDKDAKTQVKAKEEGLEWTAKVKNQTDCFVEQIAFPCVTVTGTLQEKGGEGLLFTCRNEGAVIGDADRLPKISEDYFKNGTEAFSLYYPGYVTMQYMAYLTGAEGLYFASHDAAGMPKVVWHYLWKDGLRLDIRIAPCILPNTNWEQNYPIVLRPMLGDWENAAEITREFRNEGNTAYEHCELSVNGDGFLALAEAKNPCDISIVHEYKWETMTFNVFEMGTEEAVYNAFQVLSEGGVILEPIGTLPWSKCCATIIDKYGVCWWISI